MPETFQLRPMYLGELSRAYGVSVATFRKELKRIGVYEKGRKIYYTNQVASIFAALGMPEQPCTF